MCVCVCVCVYIYIYIICVCVCVYICLCVSIFISHKLFKSHLTSNLLATITKKIPLVSFLY